MSDARRGEIWSGNYRDGFPFVCVIVSSNLYNDVMHSALIVPFAGKPGDQGNPFTVRHPEHGSLFPDRYARCCRDHGPTAAMPGASR
jgi:hypothetical protein